MFDSSFQVMLYVKDVKESINFWEKIGFKVINTTQMEGFLLAEIAPNSKNIEAQSSIKLFSQEFIKKFSPEVLNNFPSIMFKSKNIVEQHANLKNNEVEVSDIVSTPFGRSFTFQDNDGNYFAVGSY